MTIRVLHLLPHPGGGGEVYVDMLARAPGIAQERAYLSSGRTSASALASLPARWPSAAARLRRCDLVHVHGDAAAVIALPLLRARPAVLTTHGLHLLRRSAGPRRTAIALALRAAAAVSRTVICTSASEREELVAVVGSRGRGKLTVIHNGIDPPADEAIAQRGTVRAELGVGAETVLGLFVGQLEPRKAPLPAAHAAIRARAGGAPFVLALAGAGPQAAELAPLAGEAVRPLGYRADLARLLAAADVFVQPSEREGLSLALLEAMAYGLAVVAADGPGNPEAIGDAGLLFSAGDESALVAALIRLSREPPLRASLGAKARARALAQFSSERFVAATRAVYMQAVGRPGG